MAARPFATLGQRGGDEDAIVTGCDNHNRFETLHKDTAEAKNPPSRRTVTMIGE